MNGGVFAPEPPPVHIVPLIAIAGELAAPSVISRLSVMFVGSSPGKHLSITRWIPRFFHLPMFQFASATLFDRGE